MGEPSKSAWVGLEAAGHYHLPLAGGALPPDWELRLLNPEACRLANLDDALRRLTRVSAKQRRRLIDAAAGVVIDAKSGISGAGERPSTTSIGC